VLDRRTTAGQRAEVMSTVDTQPASERRARARGSAAKRPAAAKKAAAARKAAAAGGVPAGLKTRRGGFRPRIVGDD